MKRKPCHVVSTDFRPTPLEHYIFPSGSNGLYLVKVANSEFDCQRFEQAMTSSVASSPKSDVIRLAQLLMLQNYNPAIIFSFSRAECEGMALQIREMCLTSPEEQVAISEICHNALMGLTEEDRSMLTITSLLPLLLNGIGVHHSGLVPILKEVVEILFSEGLVKILFATETFAYSLYLFVFN